MKISILGAGLVGTPMALDLSKDRNFEILVADKNKEPLKRLSALNIQTRVADISSEKSLNDIISDTDIVLSAVPGFMGFKTLKHILEKGKHVVDIAFFPEDLFELDPLARDKNVTAISDIGVAPGMSNILAMHASRQLDRTDSIRIYVGGLPKKRNWPWEYKAVFSPIDVIEEYTRPARFVENGKMVTREALSDPELIDFEKVGTLEAFNSDGLRSLIKTIDCPDMIEKTLRYPGHIDKIRVLKESGFFEEKEMMIHGQKIKPIDFTTGILFPKWKLREGEHDLTIMKIIVKGKKDGKACTYEYELYDEYDPASKTHSMARTTGYTASMAVRMIARGLYKRKGISAPEYVGEQEECVKFMLEGLKERGIRYHEKIIA
ncbi:MAG: saccharopine dehydrogenase family protein [Bacteroidales bacterium]|nr:saccharopine dehydrogenase family protein [Bacteroidales bacterium]MCF8388970.1 saccharopine dehydrogenase family protein [Bacteroidales bacterium]